MSALLNTRLRAAAAAAAAALVALVAGMSAAGSAEAYQLQDVLVTTSTTQAGGHPDLVIDMRLENRVSNPRPDDPSGSNDLRDLIIDLPAGMIGSPTNYPICSAADFAMYRCGPDSQIGVARVDACIQPPSGCLSLPMPLYSVTPRPDQAGLIAFTIPLFAAPVYTSLTARTESDYGLVAETLDIQHLIPMRAIKQTLWGVPAHPSHDGERYSTLTKGAASGTPTPSNVPERPLLQNPTTCGVPLQVHFFARAYNGETDNVTVPFPGTTGCGQLSFNPSLSAKPTTTAAESPSGLEVDLTVPQEHSATTPAPSQIEAVTVDLPEGVAINPNAADGKAVCTDAQAMLGTRAEAQCPEQAKVGLVSISSGVLPGDLEGALYLGEPKPGDKYRLLIVVDGFGLHVKLPGSVRLDPATGKVKTVFENLPQFPFELFRMRFFGAERGLLVTPERCGSYAVNSTFVPWNSELPTQQATQFFSIDSGPGGTPCPQGGREFDPAFKSAATRNTAGSHAPIWIQLDRRDGNQFFEAVDVAMPQGWSAVLRGVPYCPEAAIATLASGLVDGLTEAAAPACPAASRVGSVYVAAGSGSVPVNVTGSAYLAGPYKGAPLSLVITVPAVSGPYDLGVAAVRVAVNVDPVTARVSAASDPFPRILDGIPLRLRSILIDLDRPGFALNPTGCEAKSVDAALTGSEGAQAARGYHFEAANCAALAFGPRLDLRLRGSKKRRGHPALEAVLRTRPGEANLRGAQVLLPATTLLENANIRTICSRVQYAAGACPPESVYGTATAHTPILDQPLSGPVYLRASGKKLPDLVADLRGQVRIELSAQIDSVKRRLRTTFRGIPDVPVESFVLRMQGGNKSLLVNSRNVCAKPQRASVRFEGQSRRVVKLSPAYQGCGKKRALMKRRYAKHGKGGAR